MELPIGTTNVFSPPAVPDTIFYLLPTLPVDIQDRICSHLSSNDIACGLRQVNKAAAATFCEPQHKTVRLSQPVPPHAFAFHFGPHSDAYRHLTFKRRLHLLCLTAASGVLENLILATESAGLVPSDAVLHAAAAAGQHSILLWLRQQGYGSWDRSLLEAAAAAGRQDTCAWLLTRGAGRADTASAVLAAARTGHVQLMDFLISRLPAFRQGHPGALPLGSLLAAVAEGCDLATMQRLYDSGLRASGDPEVRTAPETVTATAAPTAAPNIPLSRQCQDRILDAAARSPRPDWREKILWLEEGLGFAPVESCYSAAAGAVLPDTRDRLVLLRNRGYPLPYVQSALTEAARVSNTPAVEYLLGEFGPPAISKKPTWLAAENGHLAALQLLHAGGCRMHPLGTIKPAARGGHLAVVAWLVEVLGVAVEELSAEVMDAAAESGSLELLTWLHERGGRWGKGALGAAAEGGCVAAMEWLVERGCPVPTHGWPFRPPASRGDRAALRCLRRLGCPVAANAPLLTRMVAASFPLADLRWLVEEQGCLVDWAAAMRAAERRRAQRDRREVLAWLRKREEEVEEEEE